ncbi:MAG: M1 family metallopeptidase, partial [bacterium]
MKRFMQLPLFLFCTFYLFQVVYAQKIDIYHRPKQTERSRDYDAIHYRIKLKFDEDKKAFWGENTITLSPFKDGFKTCILDAETFRVTTIINEKSKPLAFEQKDGTLIVHLSQVYNYADTLSFTVFYFAENVDVDAEKFGMSKTYDLGLDFKDETPDHPRIINTLSFPEGARHWFPCYDHPNDKVTNELIVTVRSDYKVLANGRLMRVTENKSNKTKTFHWSQEQPHSTYLFVLVAGPYEIIADSLGTLPINYWVYKKDVKNAMRSFKKTPEIIAFYNKEYGFDYPWVKYDQITIPGIGGGAESTTATVLGQSTIHDARAEQDFPSHWLVAHEAAHQWWGDLVTMRDWSQAWINESFATYSEYLFSRHDSGEDEGAVNLLEKKNAYLRETHTRYIRPIVFDRWRYPNDMFDAHLYPKGAVV